MERRVSRFCPSCEEEHGEHDRYCVKCGSKRKTTTQSPPENIKRTKTLDNFIQEKGKEIHGLFKQKKFGIPVALPLVPGHLRSTHPRTCRGFDKCSRGRSRAAATSKMERFVIIVKGWKPLTIITKRSILDVRAALDLPLCRVV